MERGGAKWVDMGHRGAYCGSKWGIEQAITQDEVQTPVPSFVGKFEHQLDPKGRVVLPSSFRDRFAPGAYLTVGKDGCIEVWTMEAFEQRGEELQAKGERDELDRAEVRAFFNSAFLVKPDAQGRVLVERTLREYADLFASAGSTAAVSVTVAGSGNHVELWAPHLYEAESSRGATLRARGQRRPLAALTEA